MPHDRIIIAQYCLRIYHFHTIYPCHCHDSCRRHCRHYSHRYPYHLCYRKEENQQLATNAILPTGAIEIVDKIASKIAVNIARVNGALLALWRSIFSFFQIHSIPVHDFYGLRNGPTLIDILFSIYKGFTFATKKMMPLHLKLTFQKRFRSSPKLPNPKADAESTRIAVLYFGSTTHVRQLRRRRAATIRVPVSCVPFFVP